MALSLLLQPMRVATGGADEDGRLVLANGRLVAVLVRLADEVHAGRVGSWFLEAGFGPCAAEVPSPTFESLDAAQAWVERQLAAAACPPSAAPPAHAMHAPDRFRCYEKGPELEE